MEEVVNRTARPDSVSFGTPSTGVWKAYVDLQDMEVAKKLIDNGAELFEYAKKKDTEARE